jgi:hypothetical protein
MSKTSEDFMKLWELLPRGLQELTTNDPAIPTLMEGYPEECTVVLPYDAAVQAVHHLASRDVACVAWDLAKLFPDGLVGEDPGTVELHQKPGELWGAFVHRCAAFCRETMAAERAWLAQQSKEHGDSLPYRAYFAIYSRSPILYDPCQTDRQ